jgi:hypothetical protein
VGRPNPKLRLIGTAKHGGCHSAVQARIGGVSHLVGAGELLVGPGSWPRISNIADEARPKTPPDAQETASRGVLGRRGTAASHFNDVDSASDTKLGLFPFMYAGLRIADLRDPAQPKEIAYSSRVIRACRMCALLRDQATSGSPVRRADSGSSS